MLNYTDHFILNKKKFYWATRFWSLDAFGLQTLLFDRTKGSIEQKVCQNKRAQHFGVYAKGQRTLVRQNQRVFRHFWSLDRKGEALFFNRRKGFLPCLGVALLFYRTKGFPKKTSASGRSALVLPKARQKGLQTLLVLGPKGKKHLWIAFGRTKVLRPQGHSTFLRSKKRFITYFLHTKREI